MFYENACSNCAFVILTRPFVAKTYQNRATPLYTWDYYNKSFQFKIYFGIFLVKMSRI